MEAIVQMTGHVGAEVELRGGGKVAAFRLACTPRVRGKDGEYSDGNTTWIDVTCFRTLATHVHQSLRKGDAVIVVGKLRTSVWSQDGQNRERLGLEADTVGHDLLRGTAMFRKSSRLNVGPVDADEPRHESHEGDDAEMTADERLARAEEMGQTARAA